MAQKSELNYVIRVLAILSIIAIWVNLSGCQTPPCKPPKEPVVHYTDDPMKMDKYCGSIDARACAHVYSDGRCTIWIAERQPDWVMEHERCHCAGIHHPRRPTVNQSAKVW